MVLTSLLRNRIFMASAICVTIISTGTAGYMLLEDYSLLSAFYMTIITVTTVGFGEIHPLSDQGRIFTTFLIMTGFGSLGFVGHALVESVLQGLWSKSSEVKKMEQKIAKMEKHFIICGYGRVGEVAAEHFRKAGVDFVIIEAKPEACEAIKEKNYLFVEGNAVQEAIMLKAGIKRAAGLLALLSTDPDNLFIALSARELNPTLRIVSRSEKTSSEHKILQAGADSVVSPFTSAGQQIADNILLATGKQSLLTAQQTQAISVPQWVDIQEGSSMAGKNIGTLSKEMDRQIIGFRRQKLDQIMPEQNIKIQEGDQLLILDYNNNPDHEKVAAPKEPRKIVIIDDNPVIVRLYVRLFQKAGFSPLTANNGQEGLELILRENPPVAVIDFKLPKMSGIEICTKIRANQECRADMQLVLFTANEDEETRTNAIKAGANAVVVKSSNASEVIEAVIHQLEKSKPV